MDFLPHGYFGAGDQNGSVCEMSTNVINAPRMSTPIAIDRDTVDQLVASALCLLSPRSVCTIDTDDALILKPKVLPEVIAVPACRGTRASGSALGDGISVVSKRRASEESDIVDRRTKVRGGITYTSAVCRTSGAIIAPTRTGEEHTLPSGNQRTCLVDAVYNAALTLDPKSNISLKKLRTAAIPKLGNVLEASPESLHAAFAAQNAPFHLKESTTEFNGKGGTMLNILNASPGAYLAIARVTTRVRSSTDLEKRKSTTGTPFV